MTTSRSTLLAERLIVLLAILATMFFIGKGLYNYGYTHGQSAKVCASVPGQQVVSSTVDTCTYANAYGRSVRVRKAI
jgi:hypothetical protein